MSLHSKNVVSICDDRCLDDDGLCCCEHSFTFNHTDEDSIVSLLHEDEAIIFVNEMMDDLITEATLDDDMSDTATETTYDMNNEDLMSDMDGFDLQFYTDHGGKDGDNTLDNDLIYNVSDVTCPLCSVRVDGGEAITLDCNHTICIPCFQSHIQQHHLSNTTVTTKQINQPVICPLPICNYEKPVNASVVKQVLDLVPSFSKNITTTAVTDRLKSSSVYHICPTGGCTNVLYWKEGNGPPIGDCFQCNNTSCLKCGVFPYHRDQTCEEYKAEMKLRESTHHRANIVDISPGSVTIEQRNDKETLPSN